MKNTPSLILLAAAALLSSDALADPALVNDDSKSRLIFWKNEATLLKGKGSWAYKFDGSHKTAFSTMPDHWHERWIYDDQLVIGNVTSSGEGNYDVHASGQHFVGKFNEFYGHRYPTAGASKVSHSDGWDLYDWTWSILTRGSRTVTDVASGGCGFYDSDAAWKEKGIFEHQGVIFGNLDSYRHKHTVETDQRRGEPETVTITNEYAERHMKPSPYGLWNVEPPEKTEIGYYWGTPDKRPGYNPGGTPWNPGCSFCVSKQWTTGDVTTWITVCKEGSCVGTLTYLNKYGMEDFLDGCRADLRGNVASKPGYTTIRDSFYPTHAGEAKKAYDAMLCPTNNGTINLDTTATLKVDRLTSVTSSSSASLHSGYFKYQYKSNGDLGGMLLALECFQANGETTPTILKVNSWAPTPGTPCASPVWQFEIEKPENRAHGDGRYFIKTVGVSVEMRITDRDDPKKKWADNVIKTAPVYSGKSTGDMVSWKLVGTDALGDATFSWSAEGPFRWTAGGPETKNGPSGAGKNEWKIADGDEDTANDWLMWKPGKYTIKCVIDFGGGSAVVEFQQKVGVRTDDVVVVGWIDPAQVTLNPSGVQGALTLVLPSGGLAYASSMAKQQAGLLFKHIAEEGVSASFELVPLAFRVRIANVSFTAFSPADKIYTLNWMFKFAGNSPPPPSSFADIATGYFDQQKLDDFANQNDSTGFKLLNHYQAKYRVDEYGKFIIEPGKTRLGELKSRASIGNTKDPSHLYDTLWDIPGLLSFLNYPPGGVFPGVASDRNTQFSIVDDGRTTTRLLNEGRPDQNALDAFFKLTGQEQGWIWSSIGFFSDLQICSDTMSPTTGNSLTRAPRPQEFSGPRINTQVYPTFWIYINGKITPPAQNQAPSPLALFPNTDRAE